MPTSQRLQLILVLTAHTLGACHSLASAPIPVVSQTPEQPPTQAPIPSSSGTPGTTAAGCYYVWATRELPSLGKKLDNGLAKSGGDFTASAYAFGEDCRHDDGTTTFLAMETDFRVRVAADSLSDKTAMGTAILQVMQEIQTLPRSEVPGTRPGRVEFEFYRDSTESLRLSIDISKFLAEAQGLRGAALFEHFRSEP